MQKAVTIEYVPDGFREFGDNGAGIKVMCAGGEEFEVSTNRETAPKLIDALKKLVGQEVTVEGNESDWGFKVDKAFRFPGDPRQSGGGNWKGGKGGGDWETHAEREFKDGSIVAQVAAKLIVQASVAKGDDVDLTVASVEQYGPKLAVAIRQAAVAVAKEGGYPAAAVKPKEEPKKQEAPSSAPAGPGPIAQRIQEVIAACDGDALGVVRAKVFLKERAGHDDFSKLDAAEWAEFLSDFMIAEHEAHVAVATAALAKEE